MRYAEMSRSTAGVLLAGAMVLSGCQSYQGTSSSGGSSQGPPASPVQHSLMRNIPLPVGFELQPERSVAHESGQLRVAQLEFTGNASPEQVTRFYVNHMPSARFVLKKRRFDNGEYELRFESAAEECNVRVRGGRTQTTLVIDVSPLPKGTPERKPAHAGYSGP
jgi:hypothetical protein